MSPRSLSLLVAGALLSGSAVVVPNAGKAGDAAQGRPELPRILSARVVLGLKHGRIGVRVSYCYSSLPDDPSRRPVALWLTVKNLRDNSRPLSVTWPVTTRCNTVIHPLGGLQQPYTLLYKTESEGGTLSKQGQREVPLHPALARRPDLPTTFKARVVADAAYGKAMRVSYCFRSLPRDRSRRPSTIWVTIEAKLIDPRDEATLGTTAGGPELVERRCGDDRFSIKGFAPPYRVSYVVTSENHTRSKRGTLTVS